MRYKLAPVALICLALGCQSHKPSDKDVAQKNWREARASILYSLAQDQYKGHDFDKCKETVGQALQMVPDSAPLHTLAAKVDIEQGSLELAQKELELARQFAPREPEPYYLSGVIFQRWQKPQTALDYYRQASERAPAELAYVLAQGEMLVAMNQPAQALQLLQSKVAYFENSGSIRDAVGQLLMQSGRYAEAVEMFRQASILAEDDDTVRERLATAYFESKQYRPATETLERLVSKDSYSKRADLFDMMGECRMNLGDAHGARVAYETATELSPYSAHLWQSLGRAALEAGDLKRSDYALRRSLAIDATISDTHLLIGYVRLKEGKLHEALTAFQKASSLAPSDTVSLCMVGYALEKEGRSEEAMGCYSRAMKIKPGDDMAKQLMAAVEVNK